MKRILLVDDSKSIQRTLTLFIQSIGAIEVVGVANDGEEGIEKYKTLKPDIVFLDITMPNKDGRECLKEILEFDKTAHVVILSALNSSEIIDECIKMGAKAFIDKTSIADRNKFKLNLTNIIFPQLKAA